MAACLDVERPNATDAITAGLFSDLDARGSRASARSDRCVFANAFLALHRGRRGVR
jgi:hypothetical protein